MSQGRADEAGPLLERYVEEVSAGNGQAQSSVPTFKKQSKYNGVIVASIFLVAVYTMSPHFSWDVFDIIPGKPAKIDNLYYLRSKMIVLFLEFDFFWEKFLYTLVNTNCTFTGKCSFHKKNSPKVLKKLEK